MGPKNITLQIDRQRHSDSRVCETDLPPLGAGDVRLRVERFAVTANTVTYATAGDALGYWDFFPTGDPRWGCVPAMGWGEIVESKVPDLPAGGRYYGWFPMARFIDVTATPTADGLRDDGPHRAAHAPVYRAYVATGRDPFHAEGPDAEDRHALLRGLFITGWLAEDFFEDNGWFGARRVLVVSASSKTAIGFARCADAREGLDVIGLTSPANHAFTHGLGCYDEALTYDEIDAVPASAPIVAIDMAGSGPVLASVHSHFGDRLKHSMAVGRSHHGAAPRSAALAGPKPVFFFAPTQVKKRLQEWGPEVYRERIAAALGGFVDWSRDWLSVRHSHGPGAAVQTWRDVHAGRVPPEIGHVVSLWD